MNRTISKLLSTSAALTLIGTGGLAACAKSGSKTSESERAQQASGEMVRSSEVTAIVQSVDRQNRRVTLLGPEGEVMPVDVGDSVALERIQPNDEVKLKYQEAVALEIQEPGTAPTMESAKTTQRLPEGVEFGRRISSTVEILSVAPDGSSATFRDAEGDVRTVTVERAEGRRRVSALRPGDSVDVTYTAKLSVTRESQGEQPAQELPQQEGQSQEELQPTQEGQPTEEGQRPNL